MVEGQTVQIQMVDNSDKVRKAFAANLEKALTICGGTAEGYAKDEINGDYGSPRRVDTGLLHNSITYGLAGESPNIGQYSGDRPRSAGGAVPSGSYSGTLPADNSEHVSSAYVGTNVEYAPYIHEGFDLPSGGHVSPNRFIRNALGNNVDKYKGIIEKALSEI